MNHGKHTIHRNHWHCGWDNSFEPILTIAPGEVIEFETTDSSGGQLTADSGLADLIKLDFSKVNPVTGPVYVDGAEPGDILKISLMEYKPSGWGWTANIPGFGLLSDEFSEPALKIWNYDSQSLAPAVFSSIARVPLKPFAGTMGVAPAEKGTHSVVPPRRVGGNMDIRDLAAGSELYLPVEVTGALFSIGDTHACQGDGEVCGTAVESPMDVVARLDLIKQKPLANPRYSTPGPVSRHLDAKGYDVTTGVGPDLMTGAKQAVAEMIELLGVQHGLSAVDSYMLCSVCGDLRISEIVDMPNWLVSFYFPRIVFH